MEPGGGPGTQRVLSISAAGFLQDGGGLHTEWAPCERAHTCGPTSLREPCAASQMSTPGLSPGLLTASFLCTPSWWPRPRLIKSLTQIACPAAELAWAQQPRRCLATVQLLTGIVHIVLLRLSRRKACLTPGSNDSVSKVG